MRFFDIEARKLEPDVFITGLSSISHLASSGLYKSTYSNQYPSTNTTPKVNRQIARDGKRSYELNGVKLASDVQDFAISMLCMPALEGESLFNNNVFTLELVDFNRYKFQSATEESVISFDNTCHYLSVTRAGDVITILVDEKRYTFNTSRDVITDFTMFSGPGSCLIDKLIFSKQSKVLRKEYYDQLIPSKDINALDEDSYLEWVFAQDTINPRIYTYRDSELINGYYITPVVMLEGQANTIRNLSKFPIEVTYDSGQNWVQLEDLEKISRLTPSVIVRSASRDFEFVLDSYDSESINLPGVTVEFEGSIYPYHRDERTFYTNAEYDFSSASVYIRPIEDHRVTSIWIYGRLSQEVLGGLPLERIYRDGKLITASDVEYSANRLYLLVLNSDIEVVLNPDKNKKLAINALGTSTITDELDRVEKAYNLFAGNTLVSFAEETGAISPGVITEEGDSYRIIDVQWTI